MRMLQTYEGTKLHGTTEPEQMHRVVFRKK